MPDSPATWPFSGASPACCVQYLFAGGRLRREYRRREARGEVYWVDGRSHAAPRRAPAPPDEAPRAAAADLRLRLPVAARVRKRDQRPRGSGEEAGAAGLPQQHRRAARLEGPRRLLQHHQSLAGRAPRDRQHLAAPKVRRAGAPRPPRGRRPGRNGRRGEGPGEAARRLPRGRGGGDGRGPLRGPRSGTALRDLPRPAHGPRGDGVRARASRGRRGHAHLPGRGEGGGSPGGGDPGHGLARPRLRETRTAPTS